MNLTAVAEEVAARLNTIDGLDAFAEPPMTIVPPAAIVLNPEPGNIVYDKTYGRGMDEMILPVLVIVGRSDNRSANETVRAYLNGSGTQSIHAVLRSGTYSSLHTIRAETGGVGPALMGGVEYVAALIDLHITGQGS